MYAAYNGTDVDIRVHCGDEPLQIKLQWVLRSSPCYREFSALSTQQR